MKLSDFVPSKATVGGLQGVETELQSRRYASNWSLAVAVLVAAFKIAQLVQSNESLTKALDFLRKNLLHPASWHDIVVSLTSGQTVLFCIAFLAAGLWVMLRYTGVLFKQTQRPFRYTFSIENFTQVKDTPGPRFTVDGLDQMNLLTNDLIERLKRRVQRFSLLEKAGTDGTASIAKGPNAASHFHIKAEYAIREDEGGVWAMHVWPRVRIGADSNSFTLANPVRLPIVDGSNPNETESKGVLDLEEYHRLVERVYSCIATEIYKQIEIDLRDKMTLFPTLSLRALARYVEAEDFETSNTIDAYDRALEMYQTSLDELKASFLHKCKKLLRFRSALEAEAKTNLGYSRCKIYRRLVSEMAGRNSNPIFVSRRNLEEAISLLRQAYNSFFWRKRWSGRLSPTQPEDSNKLASEFSVARNAIRWPLARRHEYRRIRGELCETLAVDALAHSLLLGSQKADLLLKLANTLTDTLSDTVANADYPDRVRLLLLLAKAELEPRLQEKLTSLNDAIELNLDSEIALYRHAYYSDLLARDQNEITKERVKYLADKYEAVLRSNPANIASLIGQGYLLWLVGDLAEARKKFLAGIELQKIVKQTFVGDLKYGLARVEVELVANSITTPYLADNITTPCLTEQRLTEILLSLKKVVFPYEEATIADPSVAASYSDQQAKTRNSNFDRINRQMLERYRGFANRTRFITEVVRLQELELGRIPDILLCYALNDYGNACLNYFMRFEYFTGKAVTLHESLGALAEAVSLNPDYLMAEYNLFLAATWAGDPTKIKTEKLLSHRDTLPFPARVSVVNQAIAQNADRFADSPPDQELDPSSLPAKTDRDHLKGPQDSKNKIKSLEQRITSLEQQISSLEQAIKLEQETKSLEQEIAPLKEGKEARSKSVTASAPSSEPSPDPLKRVRDTANDKPGGKKKYIPEADSASSKSVTEKPPKSPRESLEDELRQTKALLKKLETFAGLEEPILEFAKNNMGLAQFGRVLDCESIDSLIIELEKGQSDLGDKEVDALDSIAQMWAARKDKKGKDGSLRLCDYLLEKFRRDDFGLNYNAFQIAPEEKRAKYVPFLNRGIEQGLKSDPQSCHFKSWAFFLCEMEVDELQKESKYSEAIERLEKETKNCEDFPVFHERLASAYEKAEQAKTEGAKSAAKPAPAPDDRRILHERRKASELVPGNKQYRDSLLTALATRLVSGNTFANPLDGRVDPKLIEVELSDKSTSDLGLVKDGLTPQLEQRITELRTSLKQDVGFVLPGINFRDNVKFPAGQFHLLVRGVPLAFEVFPEVSQQEVPPVNQEEAPLALYLAERVGAVARKNAAQLFTTQDCFEKLNDLARSGSDGAGIRNSPESLLALTWVLKTLLTEQASIVDLGPIVPEFLRCQSSGLGLIRTVEEIRSLPEVRKRLRGNSLVDNLSIFRLPSDLGRRLEQSIDLKSSEPVFIGSSALRQEVCSVARQAVIDADSAAFVVLTSPPARPFVFKMLQAFDMAVLSYREIFPSLLSHSKESDAPAKTIRASAGN
jgi:hypothetical protein